MDKKENIKTKKVGIDFDKTLFNCDSIFYKIFNAIKLNSSKNLKYKEIDLNQPFKSGGILSVFSIFNAKKYYPMPQAVEVLKEISNSGYEIYIVTNRPAISPLINLTLETLHNNNIKVDKLILGCNNKAAYAELMGFEYFIDNDEKICKSFLKTKTIPLHLCPPDKLKQANLTELKLYSWSTVEQLFTSNKKEDNTEIKFSELNEIELSEGKFLQQNLEENLEIIDTEKKFLSNEKIEYKNIKDNIIDK